MSSENFGGIEAGDIICSIDGVVLRSVAQVSFTGADPEHCLHATLDLLFYIILWILIEKRQLLSLKSCNHLIKHVEAF